MPSFGHFVQKFGHFFEKHLIFLNILFSFLDYFFIIHYPIYSFFISKFEKHRTYCQFSIKSGASFGHFVPKLGDFFEKHKIILNILFLFPFLDFFWKFFIPNILFSYIVLKRIRLIGSFR